MGRNSLSTAGPMPKPAPPLSDDFDSSPGSPLQNFSMLAALMAADFVCRMAGSSPLVRTDAKEHA